MTDFLLELRSEEIPARMQDKAREDLARLFAAELAKAGLTAGAVETYATPRRLALIARDLPHATEAASEEIKGPRAGAPPQALEGFLRKTGLAADQLVERDGVLFAVIERAGRATTDVLAEAIPAIVRAFPWPKSMRWGAASTSTESPRWVRPLHGIVALFGEDVVECEVAGVTSGAATLGHRFHHPGRITIGSAADYAEKLHACHVIVDQDERRSLIRDRAAALAAEAGLALIEDEGLVAENAGLTEWPVPLLGRFDAAFLDVPSEVIQLTARVNQKYFVCRTPLPLAGAVGGGPDSSKNAQPPAPSREGEGELANAFVCVANIEAADGGAKIVEGNRKVLAARLADARFFYETDLKVPLEEQAKKLDKIVFHEKLGTVADKVDRVAKLARWLVEQGIVRATAGSSSTQGASAMADQVERAARLAKADLVTGMVGEFPELQGVMGGYYAAAQGEPPEVAAAIRDHYKPVGAGDAVPTDPVTVAVSLADKLDTAVAMFAVDELPTGSKDPFALRRAYLAANAIIEANGLHVGLSGVVELVFDMLFERFAVATSPYQVPTKWEHFTHDFPASESNPDLDIYFSEYPVDHEGFVPPSSEREAEARSEFFLVAENKTIARCLQFAADRLKVQQREAGVRHDLIDAVFALGGEDDLVRLLARVSALQAFVGTADGANLLAGYKRAANILKKEGYAGDVARPAPLPEREGLGVGAETRDGSSKFQPTPDPSLPGREEKVLSYAPEKAEADLIAALDAAEPAAADAVRAEDFEAAMAALTTLRAPIDAFFDNVTVNDPDPARRDARLALLARVREAVHTVADFSKIEG